MAILITDLSPAYQAQAAKKLAAQMHGTGHMSEAPGYSVQRPPKQAKYHNMPTAVNGIRFQSHHEAHRYQELMLLLNAGAIRDLRLQETYTLQQGYTQPDGTRIRPIRYIADFSYLMPTPPDITGQIHWIKIVEDAKSAPTKTKAYMIKRKMMADVHGINIREV